MNQVLLTASLNNFLQQRAVVTARLSSHPMLELMADWYRFTPFDGVSHGPPADTLMFRYGGWSEGCATGFKIGLQRRITPLDAPRVMEAGITMLFGWERYSGVEPFSVGLEQAGSLEAFVKAVEASRGFLISASDAPTDISVGVIDPR